MNNIAYKINKLEVIPSQNQFANVVKIIHYVISKSEDGYYAEILGSMQLNPPQPFQFIAYEDLQQSTVIDWIKNSIDVLKTESILDQKLAFIKNPTVLKNPPWNN